jgi:hypothetical protein
LKIKHFNCKLEEHPNDAPLEDNIDNVGIDGMFFKDVDQILFIYL